MISFAENVKRVFETGSDGRRILRMGWPYSYSVIIPDLESERRISGKLVANAQLNFYLPSVLVAYWASLKHNPFESNPLATFAIAVAAIIAIQFITHLPVYLEIRNLERIENAKLRPIGYEKIENIYSLKFIVTALFTSIPMFIGCALFLTGEGYKPLIGAIGLLLCAGATAFYTTMLVRKIRACRA